MPVYQHDIDIPRMTDDALAKWRDIPAAVASDCLSRSQAMQGAIKRLTGPCASSPRRAPSK